MKRIGLLILGVIQMYTAATILFFYDKSETFNVPALSSEQSIYRYFLAVLWFSVAMIYIWGTVNPYVAEGACLLALINVVLEVPIYWINSGPIWAKSLGTIIMIIPAALCISGLSKKIFSIRLKNVDTVSKSK